METGHTFTALVYKYKNTWYQTHNLNYTEVITVLYLFHTFIYNSLHFITLTFHCPSGQFCPSWVGMKTNKDIFVQYNICESICKFKFMYYPGTKPWSPI
jgi:hypothetical protein